MASFAHVLSLVVMYNARKLEPTIYSLATQTTPLCIFTSSSLVQSTDSMLPTLYDIVSVHFVQ